MLTLKYATLNEQPYFKIEVIITTFSFYKTTSTTLAISSYQQLTPQPTLPSARTPNKTFP